MLIERINQADIAYYMYDSPIMSDHDYDELYEQLVTLEKQTGIILAGSPTQKVQGYLLDGFKKVQHSKPMLSAAKTKDINEIKKFLNGYDWYCSGKLDGITLVLKYSDGKFTQGITRGNGTVGEDVTEACRFIPNIPMRIPYKDDLEIRGECLMSWDEFNRINENLAEKYSHPRNLAAGTIRQLDLNILKERHLSFVAFECVTDIDNNKLAELDWLDNNGFETVIRMGMDRGNVNDVSEMMTTQVKTDKYPYDGLVFEINNKKISKSLGKTEHHESCRMALKWADTTYKTVLRDVEWNTGKTGIVFPTGIVDEVDLDGALTSRVTLHNITYIKELELGIGDVVTIYRSNMVIPALDDNLTRSNNLEIPSVCPMCGTPTKIVKENKSEVLMCTNDDCPGRVLAKWVTFVSKKGMDIDGLSEATLKMFLKRGYLNNLFESIYRLSDYRKELYKLPGLGKKSVDKLLAAIEASREVSLENFLVSFSIPNIGPAQAKILVKHFKTFDEFVNSCDNGFNFANLNNFGDILDKGIHAWWKLNRSQMINVAQLIRFDKEFMNYPEDDHLLAGKIFCITGSVYHYKNRSELQEKIELLGGKCSSSVSKKTNYLINNDQDSDSSKNKKAKDLGVLIITEEDFLNMIGGI